MGPDIHEFRKSIDALIQETEYIMQVYGKEAGREIALTKTKLEEGKMWAGKILEATGHKLPDQYMDKAEAEKVFDEAVSKLVMKPIMNKKAV